MTCTVSHWSVWTREAFSLLNPAPITTFGPDFPVAHGRQSEQRRRDLDGSLAAKPWFETASKDGMGPLISAVPVEITTRIEVAETE